ncbi:hypothetical protein ACPOL_0083 [Acidisarcina polymorpha]|uniref:Uncharacterized protein n=1 Tax=Acidisarcina polymorpha TaxID=2211140 RepID=A0A2Z5FRY8_9BACT|nr:DUF1223 domain-containing protein [Acidisarcina polymorpha]AXC09470.1 hypothetical protein ACPOL_0083 [Acidisarcina polymorpha]
MIDRSVSESARAWLSSLVVFAALSVPCLAANPGSPSPVLVELFTSEGCSSCPPADRLLAQIDRSQPIADAHVIVLSEHVDYWNSLGWQDPYSSHRWSERQNSYAERFGLESVYAPQMVVNGKHQVSGNDPSAVREAIRQATSSPRTSISIGDLHQIGEHLEIGYSADAAPHTSLFAVLADASDRSSVERGENAGRTLDHVAVARTLARVAPLNGTLVNQTFDIALPLNNKGRPLRLILFAQNEATGAIVGVAERGL